MYICAVSKINNVHGDAKIRSMRPVLQWRYIPDRRCSFNNMKIKCFGMLQHVRDLARKLVTDVKGCRIVKEDVVIKIDLSINK